MPKPRSMKKKRESWNPLFPVRLDESSNMTSLVALLALSEKEKNEAGHE
jgi:hypothetical protein